MRSVDLLRAVLHQRYLRAVAIALSVVILGCSGGALWLRIEYGVSLAAVTRYFTRPHLAAADLTSHLRSRETGLRLEALLESGETRWLGGMVYADRGHLTFHPHAEPGLERRWRTEWENRDLYGRLVPLYHRAQLAELIEALSSPDLRAALRARGFEAAEVSRLAGRLDGVRSEEERVRLLRRAARFIGAFEPRAMTPSWLTLGDRLRFYEGPAPAGDFVGQFALLDPGWGGRFDKQEALELSRHSHYLLITRVGERILLLDFYRGRVCRYDLTPFDHLSGSRLYRLAVAG